MEGIKMCHPVVRLRSIGLLLFGLVLGYVASLGSVPTSVAQAEVTEAPRREAFKAGGVLNEPVLREIAATLKRIETKLEKFERNAKAGPDKELPQKLNTGRTPSATRK